jgi:hypothetical protein
MSSVDIPEGTILQQEFYFDRVGDVHYWVFTEGPSSENLLDPNQVYYKTVRDLKLFKLTEDVNRSVVVESDISKIREECNPLQILFSGMVDFSQQCPRKKAINMLDRYFQEFNDGNKPDGYFNPENLSFIIFKQGDIERVYSTAFHGRRRMI